MTRALVSAGNSTGQHLETASTNAKHCTSEFGNHCSCPWPDWSLTPKADRAPQNAGAGEWDLELASDPGLQSGD